MFDANARYLPKGRLFFAEAHYIKPGSYLSDQGFKSCDVIFCEMMTEGEDDVNVLVHMPKGGVISITKSNSKWEDGWLVFAGSADGTGFIDDEVKEKALACIGGKWMSHSGTKIKPIKNLMEV